MACLKNDSFPRYNFDAGCSLDGVFCRVSGSQVSEVVSLFASDIEYEDVAEVSCVGTDVATQARGGAREAGDCRQAKCDADVEEVDTSEDGCSVDDGIDTVDKVEVNAGGNDGGRIDDDRLAEERTVADDAIDGLVLSKVGQ